MLLGLGLILVIALPATTELPPVATTPPPRLPASPTVEPLAMGAAMLAAPIFAPDRQPARADGGSAADAADAGLPGVTVVGVVRVGRNMRVLMRDGTAILSLAPGASVRGWRIIGVDADAITLDRDGDRRRLAIGAASTPTDASAADEESQDPQ
jgi:hypothetical protein